MAIMCVLAGIIILALPIYLSKDNEKDKQRKEMTKGIEATPSLSVKPEKAIPVVAPLPIADYEKSFKIAKNKTRNDTLKSSSTQNKESGVQISSLEIKKPIMTRIPSNTPVRKEEPVVKKIQEGTQIGNNKLILESKNDPVKKIENQTPYKKMVTDAKREKGSEGYKFQQLEKLRQLENEFPFTLFERDTPLEKKVLITTTDINDPYKGIKAIVLKNGKIIEGKMLFWNPDIVKIRTKEGKVLSYDFKKEVERFIIE
jgi:hypothetical protein